jgi:NADPH:quinone reductase-like Zn-dependent oxidoreductase
VSVTERNLINAIIYTHYGSPDVRQLTEMETPVPKEGEVLVKVQAASVNAYDWHFMRGSPFLVRVGGRHEAARRE